MGQGVQQRWVGWSQGRDGLGAGSIKHVLACQWSGTWGISFCFVGGFLCFFFFGDNFFQNIVFSKSGRRDQLLVWAHIPQAPGAGILLWVGQARLTGSSKPRSHLRDTESCSALLGDCTSQLFAWARHTSALGCLHQETCAWPSCLLCICSSCCSDQMSYSSVMLSYFQVGYSIFAWPCPFCDFAFLRVPCTAFPWQRQELCRLWSQAAQAISLCCGSLHSLQPCTQGSAQAASLLEVLRGKGLSAWQSWEGVCSCLYLLSSSTPRIRNGGLGREGKD